MITDSDGRPADGSGLDPGYVFSPYVPREREPKPIDLGDFSVRKGFSRSALFPIEPSAVDRLAALADQNGEAGQRVKAWETAREEQRERFKKWKVYKDPTYERGKPLTLKPIKPINPAFFGECTLESL